MRLSLPRTEPQHVSFARVDLPYILLIDIITNVRYNPGVCSSSPLAGEGPEVTLHDRLKLGAFLLTG
jgi:hypothetical protein